MSLMRILRSRRHLFWQMPRNARVVAPGIPYHVTQRGTNREQVFFAIGDRKLYLQLIRENLREAGVGSWLTA
jgi:putative transposase